MTDSFALFGLPPRPALDTAALKEKYLQLAATWHPDSEGGDQEKFRALQESFRTLLDPAARLRHLLDLQFDGLGNTSIPTHQDLFLKVGECLQRAKAFQHRLEKSQSSLARALLAEDRESVMRHLRETSLLVGEKRSVLQEELAAFDARWPEVGAAELGGLASSLTFLTRWQAELTETEFRLTHAGG